MAETKVGRAPKPKISKQEQHYTAYVEMAEQCEQQGKLLRAAEYRHMAAIALENWGPLLPIVARRDVD